MLDWTQLELAAAARVSKPTVTDFECGKRMPHPNNRTAMRRAMEEAGVEFLTDGDGLGVRLKTPPTGT